MAENQEVEQKLICVFVMTETNTGPIGQFSCYIYTSDSVPKSNSLLKKQEIKVTEFKELYRYILKYFIFSIYFRITYLC